MFARGLVFWQASALFVASLLATPCPAEADASYSARVVSDEAMVRSGPGEEYYRTAQLDRGATVDVYHRDENGWCAIRPTSDSFSWIAAQHIRPGDEPRLGEIVQDGVPSRIGSRLGRQRHAVQVRLSKGEVVEVLGRQQAGDHTWYRIAPPRGEFRWIAERDLESVIDPTRTIGEIPTPESATTAWQGETGKRGEVSAESGHLEPRVTEHMPPPPATGLSDGKQSPMWKPAEQRQWPTKNSLHQTGLQPTDMRSDRRQSANKQPESVDSEIIQIAESQPDRWHRAGTPTWRTPGQDSHAPRRTDGAARLAPSRRTTALAPAAQNHSHVAPNVFVDSLETVDLDLSRVVAGPPRMWRFDRLRHRATVLLNMAPTNAGAADAQRLLAKISRFEEIQHRRASLENRGRTVSRTHVTRARSRALDASIEPRDAALPDDDFTSVGPSESGDLVRIPENEPRPPGAARYDAVGVLKRVGSRRRDAPRFALVDPTGDIVSFITPSPGVNLQPFVNQRVGVYGTRGYMPEFRRAHVTAARVTPLESLR